LSEVKAPSAPEVIDRAAFLTEYLATTDIPAVEATKAEEPSAEATDESPEATEGESPDPAPEAVEAAAEEEQEEAAPAPEPTAVEEKPDSELAKRLEAINRQERRAKESIAKERADIENQLKEWAPRIQQAEAFEALRSRVKYDPVRVLQELGLTPEEFEPVAKAVYAHSKAAESNPALREQAARSAREREAFDRLAALERQNQTLLQKIEQQNVQQRVAAYMDTVAKAVSDDTPLVKNLMANDPAEGRNELHQMAVYLFESTGEQPDPEDVVLEYEKFKQAEAKKLGLNVPTKTKTPVAGEQRTAPVKTVSNQLTQSTTAARKTPKSRKEEEIDVLAALESGRTE
jgi:hypothetical protein